MTTADGARRSAVIYARVRQDVKARVDELAAETGLPIATVVDVLLGKALDLPYTTPLTTLTQALGKTRRNG